MAEMSELAGACLKNGVGRKGVKTYEAICKDLNINKTYMTLIPINWSQICFLSIFLDPLAIYKTLFFSDPNQFLKVHILQEKKLD